MMQDQSDPAGKNYAYTPLRSPSSIRTLTIQPGTYESEIQCSLREVDIDDATTYTALSYVWGTPIISRTIYCHDSENRTGTLGVTENLYAALRRSRPLNHPITMWVDAVNINQDDLDERSQQVLLMREIYSKSARLFIWLGENLESYDAAFDYMFHALEKYGYPPGPDGFDTADVKELVGNMISSLTDEVLSSLEQLFSNNWFRRAWTFQESFCASEPEVLAANRSIPYKHVANFCQLVMDVSIPMPFSNPLAAFVVGHVSSIRGYRDSPNYFIELAMLTRSRDATDPRDKLYSIITMAKDRDAFPHRPDYRVAVTKIYQDYAVAWIVKYEGINLLDLCVYAEDRLERPSWVPDFANSKDVLYHINTMEDPFQACGPYDESKTITIRNSTLSTPGLMLDYVAKLAKRCLTEVYSSGSVLDRVKQANLIVVDVVQEAFQMADIPGGDLPNSTRTQAFCWTMLRGSWTDHCRLREHHEASFHRYRDCLQHFDPDKGSEEIWNDFDISNFLQVEKRIWQMARGRRFCISSTGRMGWIPEAGRLGDTISVLYGCSLPVLLRPKGEAYEVIGTCYIHGIMDGEAVAGAKEPMQQIDLV